MLAVQSALPTAEIPCPFSFGFNFYQWHQGLLATHKNGASSACPITVMKALQTRRELIGVTLRFLDGGITTINFSSSDTVERVKQLAHELIEGCPKEDELRLIFAGKQLEHGRTLSEYNIRNESTIHVVQSLRGGMYHISSAKQDFDARDGIPFHIRLIVEGDDMARQIRIRGKDTVAYLRNQIALVLFDSYISELYPDISLVANDDALLRDACDRLTNQLRNHQLVYKNAPIKLSHQSATQVSSNFDKLSSIGLNQSVPTQDRVIYLKNVTVGA